MAGQQQFGIQGQFNVSPILQGANQVNAALAKTTQQVNQLNQQSRGLANTLGNAFRRPAQDLIFLGLDLQQLGRSLAVVGGVAIGAGAASTKFAVDFGNALANVNALAQLTDQQLLIVGNRIRDLATDPQVLQGPTELANSLQFLISSGFSTADAFGVLRAASIGATAGQAEMETVTRALASTLNALPPGTINAQKALDIMFETVDKGIITFDELTASMGEVLGAVGATGISFEEFGAAVSVLTRAGIPANEAMTSLNRLLFSFVAPTTESKEKARELGIEFDLTSLRSKGLAQSLEEVTKAVGGDTEALDKLFSDFRAIRGVLALTGNGLDEFNALLESQRQATQGLGAANAALEEQLKAPGAALQLLKRDIEAAGIAIGEDFLPAVIIVTRVLRDAVVGFSELDDSVKNSVFIIGGVFAVLGGFAFVAGTTATAVGAISNAMKFLSTVSGGTAAAIRPTTIAMQQQATAATVAAAANANLVRSLGAVGAAGAAAGAGSLVGGTGPITLGQFRQLEQARTGAQAIQQVNTASTAAAISFGRLLGLAGQATIWVSLAAAVGLAANALEDFVVSSQASGRSTQELGKHLEELTKPRDLSFFEQIGEVLTFNIFSARREAKELQADLRELAKPLERPEFAQRVAQQRGVPIDQAQEIAKRQADLARAAVRQATDAQDDAFAEAQEKHEQLLANFRKGIAEAVDDPALQQRLQASYDRLLDEGPRAAAESGFSTLSAAQKAAFVQLINAFEQQAQDLEKAGNQAGADFSRGLAEQLQRDIGFDLKIPVSIKADFAPAISAAEEAVKEAEKTLANNLAPGEQRLKALEAAQKSLRIEQLQLNLAMFDAQRAFKVAQDAVKAVEGQIKQAEAAVKSFEDAIKVVEQRIAEFESQIQDAQARIGNLGQPVEFGVRVVLAGLPELENQIFGIGQDIAQLQLDLLNVNATFIPGMFDAEEAVLRAKLALLEMGEEAEELGKKAQFGIDDLISAQQRELREGVPVLRTIFDKIRAAAEGKDGGGDAKSPEEEALEAAEKNLEILRIKQQLETIELRKKIEIAQVEQQRLNLTKQLTFDPQIRELELLANQLKEVTFEEAKAGILAAREEMTTLRQRVEESKDEMAGLKEQLLGAQAALADLNEPLAEANRILEERQGVVDALNTQQEDLQRRSIELQLEEATILQSQNVLLEAGNAIIAARKKDLEDIEQRSKANAFIPPNIPAPESTWSSDVGNDYPIPFSTAQQQASNQMVAEAAAASAARSLQAADQAAGGIAELFLNLLNVLGGGNIPGGPIMGSYHEGGEVAPGLPAGTEVTARLQAGEHVLTGDQFSRLAHPVTPPMMALPSGGSNWNWNVTINNQRGSDMYSKLYREAYMRRLGGRWR